MSPNRQSPIANRQFQPLCALVIALLALAAYANSFSAPFFFDDNDVIERNPSIQSLSTGLFPPKADGMTVSGRPLVNFSLAINYAIGGMGVTGYHVVNLLIHIAAALALFGLVRRGLILKWNEPDATLAGFCVALVWVLHPLQTESVTYISQRAESIVSLFYLLTLYCFLRSGARWLTLSVICCALGMASKEVMVSAPLAVLALDAIFLGGGFRAALRRNRGYYAALFATWILLAVLVFQSAGRGGTAGASAGVTVWHYLLTQCGAIVHYLRLAVLPYPLIFDYGTAVVTSPLEAAGPGLVLALILGATIYLVVRKPQAGFVAVLFFAILAPSSSFVPVATQTIAEHRMYLPLAAPVALAVLGLWRVAGRRTILVCLVWGVTLAGATFARNRDYADEVSLWADTVRKLPTSGRAHANLGKAYMETKQEDRARIELETALRLGPVTAELHYNSGLLAQGRDEFELAARHFDAAVAMNPRYAEAHNNLALMLDALGRLPDALREAAAAVEIEPEMVEARVNLGNFLARSGRLPDALPHFLRAIELAPANALVRSNYATALFQGGKLEEARQELVRAKELAPDDFEVRQRLGVVLLQMSRPAEAAFELRRALELNPNLPAVRDLLQRIKQ